MPQLPERVLIIGPCGSGKSTLARELAARTGHPLIHLDQQYWLPGWIEPDRETWQRRVAELILQPRWIMDGNYTRTLSQRLSAADMVLFLDFPTWRCLAGILMRSFRSHGKTRPDMAPGCLERFDRDFILYVWRWRRNSGPAVMAALAEFSGPVVFLRNRAEVRSWLAQFGNRQAKVVS